MSRTDFVTQRGKTRVVALASLLALVLLSLSFMFGPSAYAQDVPPRDTRTWDDPQDGPSFTFSTLAIRDDCTSRGDVIYTTGMRAGWSLTGQVIVRRPDNTLTFSVIPVDQTTDLNLLVTYPPLSEWQQNPGNVEIHVDVAIEVRDAENELVQWVGGDQEELPGVLGPNGQDWDIFCAQQLEPEIDIIKLTNGADANAPDGADVPLITPGDDVTWTYIITNTGPIDILLAEITVTDNIPNVTPVFAAVVSGDAKGDGNGILQPGEVWRYTATGVAVNLATPPQDEGLVLVPNVCRGGNPNLPGRTAYTNIGTVEIPSMSATDPSSYCGLPVATLTRTCVESVPTWTATSDTSGVHVVQFLTGPNVVASSINLNVVANTGATFTYSGNANTLQQVRLVYRGIVVAEDSFTLGGACPTAAPPSSEPTFPGGSNIVFLPVVEYR